MICVISAVIEATLEDMELRDGSDDEEIMEGKEKVVKAPQRDDAVGCFTQHTGEHFLYVVK